MELPSAAPASAGPNPADLRPPPPTPNPLVAQLWQVAADALLNPLLRTIDGPVPMAQDGSGAVAKEANIVGSAPAEWVRTNALRMAHHAVSLHVRQYVVAGMAAAADQPAAVYGASALGWLRSLLEHPAMRQQEVLLRWAQTCFCC